MHQNDPTSPAKRVRPSELTATMKSQIDPSAVKMSVAHEIIRDDRWLEAQLEEPERWDGMS